MMMAHVIQLILIISLSSSINSFKIMNKVNLKYEIKQISKTIHRKITLNGQLSPEADVFNQQETSSLALNDIDQTKQELNATESIQLSFSQLKPFLAIAIPYFKENIDARNSLLGVSALTLANSGISVVFSYISRDFYNALNARDEALFYEKIEYFFIALIIAVPITVSYRYLRDQLSLTWREGLTKLILNKYYSNNIFYIIETKKDIDNPDQRISDDIKSFTSTSLDFFITIFTCIIDLFSFSAILFNIYPQLFIAIIIYAGFGSIITTNIGQSLVKLNYERLINEANFRFSLIRTRENAESISFYDSNAILEKNLILNLFQKIKLNKLEIINIQRNLELFTTTYRYLPNILPSLIVAPLYFAKKIELGKYLLP